MDIETRENIIKEINFDFLSGDLGYDIENSIKTGLSFGALFPKSQNALEIFRESVAEAILEIEQKVDLISNFLRKGPYWSDEPIPKQYKDFCLSDMEVTAVIAFIYSHMINHFQGKLAELLAIEPCVEFIKTNLSKFTSYNNIKLFIGDSAYTEKLKSIGKAKGADFHIINFDNKTKNNPVLLGVVEVKSYVASQNQLRLQLDNHINRVSKGIKIKNNIYSPDLIKSVCKVGVVPSSWHLSRKFKFVKKGNNTNLHTEEFTSDIQTNFRKINDSEWRIILKWSHEALAKLAYDLTFWYMGKLGEVIFKDKLPKGVENMTPHEAGLNAIKEGLYFSILRCLTNREEQRAIALYNSYCFGYALGMNFKNKKGKREMLWCEDLKEILENGANKYGSKIWK